MPAGVFVWIGGRVLWSLYGEDGFWRGDLVLTHQHLRLSAHASVSVSRLWASERVFLCIVYCVWYSHIITRPQRFDCLVRRSSNAPINMQRVSETETKKNRKEEKNMQRWGGGMENRKEWKKGNEMTDEEEKRDTWGGLRGRWNLIDFREKERKERKRDGGREQGTDGESIRTYLVRDRGIDWVRIERKGEREREWE